MSIIIVRSNPPPTENLIFPREFARRMAELSRAEKRAEEKAEWKRNHRACPVCGNTDLCVTTGPEIVLPGANGETIWDINGARCGCGWSGNVYELTAPEQAKG